MTRGLGSRYAARNPTRRLDLECPVPGYFMGPGPCGHQNSVGSQANFRGGPFLFPDLQPEVSNPHNLRSIPLLPHSKPEK